MQIMLMILVSIPAGYAVSIGISPGRVNFDEVLRDGYAQRTVRLTTNGEGEVIASARVMGDIKDWISFEPNLTAFTFTRENPYLLTIIVRPPADIRTGNYSGSIEFITEGSAGVEGRAGATVKTAVILLMRTEVSGTEIIECRAGGFKISDTEVTFPFEVSYTMFNDGNVRMRPTLTLEFWDQMQERIIKTQEVLGEEVFPTTQKKITHRVTNTITEGQYWVKMNVAPCNVNTLETISVVEKGGIADSGQFIEIKNKLWAYTNETVQFVARFQNTGSRAVNAKFKGVIRHENKIAQVIETQEIIVPPGEIADLDIFFSPPSPGHYTIDGRIIYNKKLTFERGSILNVNPPLTSEQVKEYSFIPLLMYLLIIITILFILRKIIKDGQKKKRMRRKIF